MSETLNEAALRIAREVGDFDKSEVIELARRLRAEWEKEGQVPAGFIYEWDGPFGIHQDVYYGMWNGNRPDRAVPYYLRHTSAKEVEKMDIKTMVDRFLGWKLPKDFAPDGGIRFEREYYSLNKQTVLVTKLRDYSSRWPTGTNLFTAEQARAMFEYVLEGQEVEKGSDEPSDAEVTRMAVHSLGLSQAHTDHPSRHYDRTCPACATNPQGKLVLHATLDKDGDWDGGPVSTMRTHLNQAPLYTRPQHDRVKELEIETALHAADAQRIRKIIGIPADENELFEDVEAKIAEQAAQLADALQFGATMSDKYAKLCGEFVPYLKEGETPFGRFMRERKDGDGVLELLRREKVKTEEQAAELQECKRLDALRVAKIEELEKTLTYVRENWPETKEPK